jgi:hypothetical protein
VLQLLGICGAFLVLECAVGHVVESHGFHDTARPVCWFAFPINFLFYSHISSMLFSSELCTCCLLTGV